ncbi:unnamed protein product [Trichobilharzia regenti]|nr:unnamed protein product [Trichobilharzia regenti]
MDDNSITTTGTIMNTTINTVTAATATNTSPICYFDNQYEHGLAGILITHVSISLAILGIPANLLTLIILKRDNTSTNSGTSTILTSTSRNATNFILATLATEDILIIILYNLYYVAIHYYEKYYEALKYLGLLRYADSPIYFLLNWIKVAEIYTIVLLSLQRYLAIRWPLRSAYLCSLGRTKRIIYGIFILALLLKLPNLILGYRIMVPNRQEIDDNNGWQHQQQQYQRQQPLKQATIQRLREDSTGLFINNNNNTTNNNNNSSNNKSNMFSTLNKLKRYSVNNEEGLIENKTAIKSRNSQDLFLKAASTDRATHPTTISSSSTSRGSANNSQVTLSSPTLHNQQHPYHHHHQHPLPPHPTHHHMHTQSRSVTLTLIGVITTFILCETPTTICFCYEIWNALTEDSQSNETQISNTTTTTNNNNNNTLTVKKPDFYYYAYPAALICILIGCASNFFIYILIGRKFRRMCIAYFIEVYEKLKNHLHSCYHLLCCLAKHNQRHRHQPTSPYYSHHHKPENQKIVTYALNKHCPSSSSLLSWSKKSKQINCKHKLENYRHKHPQHYKQQSRHPHHNRHHSHHDHYQQSQPPPPPLPQQQQREDCPQQKENVHYKYKTIQQSDISIPKDSPQVCA